MVDLNKVPRWALIAGFMGFMALGGITLKGAFADLDETKRLAAKHDLLIPIMQNDISEIKSDVKQILKAVKT